MQRSIIVVGPACCGTARNAETIKKHFGLNEVMEDNHGQPLMHWGVLYLVPEPLPAARVNGALVMTYADAAQMVGLS